jgi:hypothetical protein
MTLSTSGYTVGSNEPLTNARILWEPITGTVTATGTDGDLAANSYTFQRWSLGADNAIWAIQTAADADVDTVFIAAHSLIGATILIQTSSTTTGSFVTRATVTPTDNSTIAAMFNNAGSAYVVRRVRLFISGASADATVGIIRAGKALQMQQAVFGGIQPIGLTRAVETRHSMSETGQWLGRTIQRQARRTSMPWTHLTAAWYRANFDPFSLALPQTPFGLIQNPSRMPESVAWCWTDQTPQPENMGIKDLMSVTLDITGYLE